MNKDTQPSVPGQAPAQIADPVDPQIVRSQILALNDKALFQTGDYRAYLIKASEAPDAMQELYRLREVTFRGVGEGTGKALDTDSFDEYYHHLILWNIPDGEIVGAYRVGYGPDIIARKGISGFYSSTLVKFGPDAPEVLSQSMELGRSFIVEKYQKEVLPLKMMLTGLCIATIKDTKIHYCVGMVSISNALPDLYKSIIVESLEKIAPYHGAERFATPTNPFVKNFQGEDPGKYLENLEEKGIDACDRLIFTLTEGETRIPVLVRKYFNCGAKVVCFNVDPDFSDSLDAMIVLRLKDFPEASVRSFVRSLPQDLQDVIFEHFYGSFIAAR